MVNTETLKCEKGMKTRIHHSMYGYNILSKNVTKYVTLYEENVEYLLREGLRQSPLKSTIGFRFFIHLYAVTNLEAPPTGSTVAGSILYTSLKWNIVNCLFEIILVFLFEV